MDLKDWLERFIAAMEDTFGPRVVFLGIQGSRGRGEATEDSDIDVVVILDRVDLNTLQMYDKAISCLPMRDKLCGFVSGKGELVCWAPGELFQFYYDTVPLVGSLDFLLPLIHREDIRRQVHTSACGIYHMCSHNYLHAKSRDTLKEICKMCFFLLQALHFLHTGSYVGKKGELLPQLSEGERRILMAACQPVSASQEFDQLSEQILDWSKNLILTFC